MESKGIRSRSEEDDYLRMDHERKKEKMTNNLRECKNCHKFISKRHMKMRCDEEECDVILCKECLFEKEHWFRKCFCSEEKTFCKNHSIDCYYSEKKEGNRFCFGSICKKCQEIDKSWNFEKCFKCHVNLCRTCVSYCLGKSCDKTMCHNCREFCLDCGSTLCSKEDKTHGCVFSILNDFIHFLFLRINLNLFPRLKFQWNLKKMQNLNESEESIYFIYEYQSIKKIVNYDKFIESLYEITNDFSSILFESKGNSLKFRKKILEPYASLNDFFIHLLINENSLCSSTSTSESENEEIDLNRENCVEEIF